MEKRLNHLHEDHELREFIDGWLRTDASRSISHLARESGVNESTVRRMYNNAKRPSGENLFKILVCLTDSKDAPEALKRVPVAIRSYVKKHYPFTKLLEDVQAVQSSELSEAISDFDAYVVFKLAANYGGTTRSEILTQFGVKGTEILKGLLEKSLVSESETGLVTSNISEFSLPKSLTVQHASRLIQSFSKSSTEINYLLSSSDGVDVDGYGQIMDVLEEAASKISEIKKKHVGKIPMFTVLALDTVSYDVYFARENTEERQ
jgi:transcriptional regulator with XRE-family HTH domain